MEVQPDFKDMLGLFNVHKVKYMIVGGYALAYHGAPRYTGDIDIITSISGILWKDASLGCVDGKYGDVPVKYIGLNEFIINKRTTGRKKDLSDIEALGKD